MPDALHKPASRPLPSSPFMPLIHPFAYLLISSDSGLEMIPGMNFCDVRHLWNKLNSLRAQRTPPQPPQTERLGIEVRSTLNGGLHGDLLHLGTFWKHLVDCTFFSVGNGLADPFIQPEYCAAEACHRGLAPG